MVHIDNDKFIHDFNRFVNNPEVIKQVIQQLEYGLHDPLFTNYFGINYDNENIKSVKLYFSYFNNNAIAVFDKFIDNSYISAIIKKYWYPTDLFEYVHRGLTLGLKCYVKNNAIDIRKYVHLRMHNIHLQLNYFDMQHEDNNLPKYGLCFEETDSGYQEKKYAYFHTQGNIKKILHAFNLDDIYKKMAIKAIEYTESSYEQKINIANSSSDDLYSYLCEEKNTKILNFSKYIFNKYFLYFYSPGQRKGSNIKAIYFVPKEVYYVLTPFKTLNKIFHHVL